MKVRLARRQDRVTGFNPNLAMALALQINVFIVTIHSIHHSIHRRRTSYLPQVPYQSITSQISCYACVGELSLAEEHSNDPRTLLPATWLGRRSRNADNDIGTITLKGC